MALGRTLSSRRSRVFLRHELPNLIYLRYVVLSLVLIFLLAKECSYLGLNCVKSLLILECKI